MSVDYIGADVDLRYFRWKCGMCDKGDWKHGQNEQSRRGSP